MVVCRGRSGLPLSAPLPQIGAALLLCTPLVDVVLLVATAIHLRSGAEANFAHGLAAIYIGVSLVYGHSMIRWADVQFAHRFAGGPAPVKQRLTGAPHARQERAGWYRHLAAWAIGCGILYGIILMVNNPEQTDSLGRIIQGWMVVLGIDFLISFSYTLWPRESKSTG